MATFPTAIPSFGVKSTENDVAGSATRINGADINNIQNEIAAIAARVGATGSTTPGTLEYRLGSREEGQRVFAGSGTCAAGGSTAITCAQCTESSRVMLEGTSAGFAQLTGVFVSAVANGSFTVTHSTAAGGESFHYLIAKG